MDLPTSPLIDSPCTESELKRLLDDMDYHDRQETLEYIDEICHKVKKTDCPSKWWDAIQEIKESCSEFM